MRKTYEDIHTAQEVINMMDVIILEEKNWYLYRSCILLFQTMIIK